MLRPAPCSRAAPALGLLLLLPPLLLPPAAGAEEAEPPPPLFSVEVSIGGANVTVPMREGDSVHEVAQRVGAEHGLAREGVTSLVQMITRKAAQVLGGSAVKTTFFELPVTVETAPGEQQVVVLTVYEESDPARLSAQFAERYKLGEGAATKLQLEVVKQMEARTKVRVEVNLPDGSARLLTVKADETTQGAARRFGLEHGLTAQGIDALEQHLEVQLRRQGGQ